MKSNTNLNIVKIKLLTVVWLSKQKGFFYFKVQQKYSYFVHGWLRGQTEMVTKQILCLASIACCDCMFTPPYSATHPCSTFSIYFKIPTGRMFVNPAARLHRTPLEAQLLCELLLSPSLSRGGKKTSLCLQKQQKVRAWDGLTPDR